MATKISGFTSCASSRSAADEREWSFSENAEYQDAKRRLRSALSGIDTTKDKLIRRAKGASTIALGCKALFETSGKQVTFSFVGPHESDPSRGRISHESPLGKALLGCKKGEIVEVDTPAGKREYTILEVS